MAFETRPNHINSTHLAVHGIAQMAQQVSRKWGISMAFVQVNLLIPTFARRLSGRVFVELEDTPLVPPDEDYMS